MPSVLRYSVNGHVSSSPPEPSSSDSQPNSFFFRGFVQARVRALEGELLAAVQGHGGTAMTQLRIVRLGFGTS